MVDRGGITIVYQCVHRSLPHRARAGRAMRTIDNDLVVSELQSGRKLQLHPPRYSYIVVRDTIDFSVSPEGHTIPYDYY